MGSRVRRDDARHTLARSCSCGLAAPPDQRGARGRRSGRAPQARSVTHEVSRLDEPSLSKPEARSRSMFVAGLINAAALVLIDVISEDCNRKGRLLGAQPAPFEQNVDYLRANGRTWPTRVSHRVRLSPPSLVVACLAKPPTSRPANIQARKHPSLQTSKGPARRGTELRPNRG
jgi:hypothetical protein